MPYTIENPPEKIKDMPAHAIEIWVSAFNAALKQYKDEGKANATAYSAVKAEYKQDDKGNWVAKESLAEARGNFGHEGRPGEIGGSGVGGGVVMNKAKSEKWVKENYSDVEFSNDETRAASKYQSSFAMNEAARSGKIPPAAKPYVEGMDSAIGKCELPENVTTFRGVGDGVFPDNPPPMTGGVFKDKGYVSTSFDKGVSERFAKSGGGSGVVMEITAGKGTKALPMFATGKGVPSEAELVFGRNTKFRIVDDAISGGQRRIKAEVIK